MSHYNLGVALHVLGRLDEAITSFNNVLAIMPTFAMAHYNLIDLLEKSNRLDSLREEVAAATKNCPGEPLITLGQAYLLKRDGDYSSARTVLESGKTTTASENFRVQKARLLGDLCDRLGDTRAAFNYFKESNNLSKKLPVARHAKKDRYLAVIDLMAERFTQDWVATWQTVKSADDRPDPIFLVGFPRSGTTLLYTILRSHPSIAVVEEQENMNAVRGALEQMPGGYPDGLSTLDCGQLTELRNIYFAELDKHLAPEDSQGLVVDKLPLNIVQTGFNHRILPQSKFIFAQRHPCDCVLSCFMQEFALNDSMASFLDIEGATLLYDKVMTLWQRYQTLFPLKVHTVRYEKLIVEFEETVSSILDFLGLGWDDNIKNYTATAKQRSKINTPSYNQVTQPLYTGAKGRWERYREPMQPVLPTLLSWARRLDYSE